MQGQVARRAWSYRNLQYSWKETVKLHVQVDFEGILCAVYEKEYGDLCAVLEGGSEGDAETVS
jgi:hypothetical protein